MEDLITFAIQQRRAHRENVLPMSEEEVREVEAEQGAPLPLMYKAFLLAAGKGFGSILEASDFYYPRMLGLRSDVAQLLQDNHVEYEFSEFDVPFFMHGGYQVLWLHGRIDDPPVMGYSEGFIGVHLEAESFTAWLKRQILRA